MRNRQDFPIWTRNRAQRHAARGCSRLVVGLILRSGRRRPSPPVADERPSNVLPFKIPATAQPFRPPPAPVGDLRHG
ncbi:hypothetical protein [Methylobacterium sp. J-092]|jgi:hypothetical protein|uniref:hypothetical protein n=1 Tax=Methylobacterium sp. J-092 TaxID=2836667 RepID=UPI001FBB409A|nr:hypothetical protein [Methylobacterium sp. J-092]MCJ2010469.1 hypothetical protein [Methylobacterium sp. J-092]